MSRPYKFADFDAPFPQLIILSTRTLWLCSTQKILYYNVRSTVNSMGELLNEDALRSKRDAALKELEISESMYRIA